jgi:hypothetical protein
MAANLVTAPMTLAEAQRLSPAELAKQLLGAAGASGGYVEAKVSGNGGLMIASPGLNWIDLYRPPESAGFDGVCKVEGTHIQFESSRYDTRGDPPHLVTNFWRFVRFSTLATRSDKGVTAGDAEQDRACRQLAPVSERTDPPLFFVVSSDKPVDAYFVRRALVAAHANAESMRPEIRCQNRIAGRQLCEDPVATIASLSSETLGGAKVERCDQGTGWCVEATWTRRRSANESDDVTLILGTDATKIDPPTDFRVISIAITAGTSVED